MKNEINRVAIVRLSALGDIVNSAIVLQFVKAAYPKVKVEWITEEIFAPLLQECQDLDSVHTINIKQIKKTKSLSLLNTNIKKLNALREFDLIIDMQGLIKSSIVARILGKNTHGFDKDSTRESLAAFLYKTSSHISYESGVVKRNCFLVSEALDFEITDEMILNKKPIFQISHDFNFQNDKKNIAFVIGASWSSKIYPKEQLVKVCNALEQDVYIIWGDIKEKESAEWICEHSEYATLAPKLDLSELVSFISAMDLVIGNDTGPTHLAWAQNIPSITLFGPTTSRMIYETPYNLAIKSPSKVDILKIDKNDYSIKDIQAKIIVHKAKELLYGL